MKSVAVMVLGTGRSKDLTEVIFNIGFTPLVRQKIQGALEKLRHEHLAAIIVDRDNIDVDVLEFILNVRDVNKQIPVIVIDRSADDEIDQVLLTQQQTFILSEVDVPERLAEKLQHMLTVEYG